MEMPKPGPEHAKLAAMIGHWAGEETLHPTPWRPEGGTAKATVVSRLACEGFCVVTDYVEERGGQVTYVGHGVFGYDPRQQRYLQLWSDSAGGVPSRATLGTWEGDTLTFADSGPQGHVRYVYRFLSPDAYEFRIESSPDGVAFAPFLEARYGRQAALAPKPAPPRPKPPKRKPKPKPKPKPAARPKAKGRKATRAKRK